ncbi:MAG TPA: DMT family transporter [Thermoanaerobaculia bacterium]|nr:DMT family transporter [Thermoanaerobaculia bacterium]
MRDAGSAGPAAVEGGERQPPRRRALAPRLELLAAAALFSTGGAAIKAVHVAGWPVACVRSAIAAAALLAALPQVRRRPTWRMLAVAACYAATMILFVQSNKLTTAASSIYLQATAPLFVLLLGPWLLGERSRRGDLLSMAAIALGLLLLVAGLEPASATAPEPLRGNLLAALSGLTWALTIVGLRALSRGGGGGVAVGEPVAGATGAVAGAGAGVAMAEAAGAAGGDALVAAFWDNVLAAAAALPFALPLPAVRAADWLVLGFLGLFQIALAYVLLARGIGGVPALEASLLLLLEPVLNPIWAWLVHGERVGPRVLAGGALILAATLLNSWHDARLAARERGREAGVR